MLHHAMQACCGPRHQNNFSKAGIGGDVNRYYNLIKRLQQQQQQQHSLFSQASWGRLEMKPERNNLIKRLSKQKKYYRGL